MSIYNMHTLHIKKEYKRVLDAMLLTDQYCGVKKRGSVYSHIHHNWALTMLRTFGVKHEVFKGVYRHNLSIKYDLNELKQKMKLKNEN